MGEMVMIIDGWEHRRDRKNEKKKINRKDEL
jgi:hypothetical protein